MKKITKKIYTQERSILYRSYNYFAIFSFFLLAVLLTNHLAAQEITPSKRGKIICPEIAKLAESVTLARENHMPQPKVIEIINSTMKLGKSEYDIIDKMVSYIYTHSEKPIYENTIYTLIECYKYVH